MREVLGLPQARGRPQHWTVGEASSSPAYPTEPQNTSRKLCPCSLSKDEGRPPGRWLQAESHGSRLSLLKSPRGSLEPPARLQTKQTGRNVSTALG